MAGIAADATGHVERNGVRIHYDVYGDGEPTLLLVPTWSIVHSRVWKAQVPYLARHYRVITFDGRGNGRSDRPLGADAYAARICRRRHRRAGCHRDAPAIIVGLSLGGHLARDDGGVIPGSS